MLIKENEISKVFAGQPLIQSARLIDVFSVDNKTYLKIRRKELRQHAVSYKGRMLPFNLLDKFYPYSKPLMEHWYGLPSFKVNEKPPRGKDANDKYNI